MRRLFPLLGLLLVIGSCGDDSADSTTTTAATTTIATTTTIAATTTVPPTTEPTVTTVAVTSTTTEPFTEGPYVLENSGLFPPPVLAQSEGPSGSGCIPGSNTVIPDGIWYGYVLGTTGTAITFDMACWFWGDIAYTEGAKDGVEVNNDYYVRNQNPLTFQVPIGPGATMYWLDSSSGNFVPEPMPMADWPGPDEDWPCPGEDCGVWLYINGGVITEAIEQYRP
jgi:hypothetical protein